MKKSIGEPISVAQSKLDAIHATIQDKFDCDVSLTQNEVLIYLTALADEWTNEPQL